MKDLDLMKDLDHLAARVLALLENKAAAVRLYRRRGCFAGMQQTMEITQKELERYMEELDTIAREDLAK